MKLLLTSAGFTNKTIIASLQELVARPFDTVNLTFIPTAANVEFGDKSWLIDNYNECMKLGFRQLDIVDISAIPKDMMLARLDQTDILMFGGGDTAHLMYWLEKSGLKEMLPGMLETKLYVGISAGSMVATKNLALADSQKLYSEEIGKRAKISGLGFVEFHICPHFNSEFFPNVTTGNLQKIAKEFKEPIYAIDDNTAIEVIDEHVEVITEGEWKKFN